MEYLFQHGAEVGFLRNVNFHRRLGPGPWATPAVPELLRHAQQCARIVLQCDEDEMTKDLHASLQSMKKERQVWSRDDRVRVVGELGHTYPGTFWGLIEYTGGVSPDLFQSTADCRRTLLHVMVKEMVTGRPFKQNYPSLRQALEADARNHRQDDDDWTPFLALLVWSQTTADMEEAVAFWVKQCQQVGVDLCEYGRIELQRYRDVKDYLDSTELPVSSVQTFAYGPEPSDWRIWYRQPGDLFAGEFWENILWEYGYEFEWEMDNDFEWEPWVPGTWEHVYVEVDSEDEDLYSNYDLQQHPGRLAKGLKRKTIRLLESELRSAVHDEGSTERTAVIQELLALVQQLSAHHMQPGEDHPHSYPSVLRDIVGLKQQLGLLGPKVHFEEYLHTKPRDSGWRTARFWRDEDEDGDENFR